MIITLDPGISGTGIAVWSSKKWKEQLVNPVHCENLYPKEKKDFVVKTNSLLRKIENLFEIYDIKELWCEMPEFFDDAGGHMAAKKGDLVKLVFFVGAVAGICYTNGVHFRSIKPSEWKGQTSKEMVIRKIRYLLPEIHRINPKSHSYDAIGIGLWAQGFYKRI
jgi:Holliday junction resolvasome RuvABC endonuclease subunit